MKFYNLINKKWTWLTMLLIGMITVGITSCNEDEDNDVNPGGEENASAWIYAFRNETPSGAITYMTAQDEIPETPDFSTAIELGLTASVYSLGENPYTWDWQAATLTKWKVDKTTLELSVDGIMSLASTGLGGNFASPFFVSEDQAFVSLLTEGLVVEFSPSIMEIVKIHDVDPLKLDNSIDGYYAEGAGYVVDNGKIFYPIYLGNPYLCCEYYDNPKATIAIFDPVNSLVQYVHDDRLLGGREDFLIDENGDMFVVPNRENSFVRPYFDFDISVSSAKPFTVLKFKKDGAFDPDFSFDIASAVDITYLNRVLLLKENKVVISYADSALEFAESVDDKNNVFQSASLFKTVSIDMTTSEVEEFIPFDIVARSELLNTIDGKDYYQIWDKNARPTKHLFKQNSLTDFETVSTNPLGGITHVGKLW